MTAKKKPSEKETALKALKAKKATAKPKKAKGLKLATNKPAKPKKEKAASAPKIKQNHNGGVNTELVEIFDNYAQLDKDKKEISKAQRDLAASAKEAHGVTKANFMHEVKMRKLASDVRLQFEQGIEDVKSATGYQFTLDLLAKQRAEEDARAAEAAEQGDGEQQEEDAGVGHNSESDESEDDDDNFN